MKPPGLPFLFALALTFTGPPLVCGVPLLVLLWAQGEPSTVAAPDVAPPTAAGPDAPTRCRGIRQSISDQTRARSTASTMASGSLSFVSAKSTCARASWSRLNPLSTAE
jgi:hypothetical protein